MYGCIDFRDRQNRCIVGRPCWLYSTEISRLLILIGRPSTGCGKGKYDVASAGFTSVQLLQDTDDGVRNILARAFCFRSEQVDDIHKLGLLLPGNTSQRRKAACIGKEAKVTGLHRSAVVHEAGSFEPVTFFDDLILLLMRGFQNHCGIRRE